MPKAFSYDGGWMSLSTRQNIEFTLSSLLSHPWHDLSYVVGIKFNTHYIGSPRVAFSDLKID